MNHDLKMAPARDAAELLEKWRLEVVVNEESHYAAAKQLARTQMLAGYPLAVLNGVIASSVFATLSKDAALGWKITTAIFSLLAGILAAASAFGRFGVRAEAHRRAAAKFGEIRWWLEQLIATGQVDDAKVSVEIRKSLASITESAPPVQESIWQATHDRLVGIASSPAIVE